MFGKYAKEIYVQLNYLKYFRLMAAIPNYSKRKAQATALTNRNKFEEWDIFSSV